MMQRLGVMACTLALFLATGTTVQAQDVSGSVEHIDPGTGVVYFSDGRIVHLEPNATLWIDGRQVTLNDLKKGTDVMVKGGRMAAGDQSPSAMPQAVAAHPPVDVIGAVASFDPQTGILTFQDGRMVKVTDKTTAWQPVQLGTLQPGTQVFVDNALPAGYRGAAGAWPADRPAYMGTVARVDPAGAVIVLDDGTVVRVSPTTKMQMGSQQMKLSELQPGDQVVVRTRDTTAGPPASGDREQAGTADAPSALPRQGFFDATIEAEDIHLFRQPQAP